MSNFKSVIHFINSAHGVYIPQVFAEIVNRELVSGVNDYDWKTINDGPDNEWYWEAWDNVLNNATIKHDDVDYQLYEDGDLFLYCYELMTNEEKENLFGEDPEF